MLPVTMILISRPTQPSAKAAAVVSPVVRSLPRRPNFPRLPLKFAYFATRPAFTNVCNFLFVEELPADPLTLLALPHLRRYNGIRVDVDDNGTLEPRENFYRKNSLKLSSKRNTAAMVVFHQ